MIKTNDQTHALLQNVAAISGDFHTHELYYGFYDMFGKNIDGFIGSYEICIGMAQALTDWENENGGLSAYDETPIPWIEIVEHFVNEMIERAIETGDIPNARFILNAVFRKAGEP